MLKIIIKVIFCLLLSIFFIGSIFVELIVVGPCIEIRYIAIFSALMVFITWLLAFIKVKYLNKWLKIIIFLVFLHLYFEFPYYFPNVKLAWDKDQCYDDGYCKEGLKWAGEIVTKEYCLKHKLTWDERNRSCDMYSKSK